MEKTGFFDEFNSTNKEITIDDSYFNLSYEFIILTISGMIDTYNSTPFYKKIIEFIALQPRKVLVIDMSRISYVSSTGIGAFIELLKFAKSNNIVMYLMQMQPNVSEVFSLLGFNAFFNFIDELKDINEEKIKRSSFPITIKCPYCSIPLNIVKVGAFKCKSCSGVIRINVVDNNITIEKRGE